jgi:hypothetical protein
MAISRWTLLKMRIFLDNNFRGTQKTHFTFNRSLPPRKYCLLWDNVEKYGTAGHFTEDIIQRMSFAYLIPKATNTLLEYIILIAFPLQRCLHKYNSVLRVTCTVFLVICHVARDLSQITRLLLFRFCRWHQHSLFWHSCPVCLSLSSCDTISVCDYAWQRFTTYIRVAVEVLLLSDVTSTSRT